MRSDERESVPRRRRSVPAGRFAGIAIIAAAILGAAPAGAGPEVAAAPAAVRLVILREAALLPSETRALGRFDAVIGRAVKGRTYARNDASPEERAFAVAHLGPKTPSPAPAWPAAWRGADLVVVIEILPPNNRVAGGMGGILLFRGPEPAPVYVERMNKTFFASEDLDGWLARAVKSFAAAGGGGAR